MMESGFKRKAMNVIRKRRCVTMFTNNNNNKEASGSRIQILLLSSDLNWVSSVNSN